MTNTPRESFQLEPARDRSLRREIVDVLEHCYGPLLLSIGFGVFLTLDPAREVMVVYASEIVAFFGNFGTYWPGLLIVLALVAAVLTFAARERTRTGRQMLAGALLAGLIICVMTFEWAARTFLGGWVDPFFDGEILGLSTTALVAVIDAVTRWVQEVMTVPARILIGALAFFYVPIALWWATGYALKAQQDDMSPGFLNVGQLPKNSFAAWVLMVTGRVPLVFGGWALLSEGVWGQEATRAESVVLIVLAILSAGAALIRVFASDLNERALGPAIRSAPFGLAFVATFVALSFLLFNPVMTVVAGPIAIASMFVILASLVLAGLTYLSKRASSGHFPLVLILVALAVAAGSARGAFIMAVAAAVMVYLLVWRRSGQALWRYIGVALVVVLAGLGVAQMTLGPCRTAAGCNIIQGVELPENGPPPSHVSARAAFEAWDAAREPGPVALVAAQGGGLFAGYHAAYDLAYRQDISVQRGESPSFADRLFVVSGVSGGSFGAAAFWAVRQSGICERWAEAAEPFAVGDHPGCYTHLTNAILDRDYLSLSLSGLLFADFADSFLPYSALFDEPMDRAHRFTEQFIEAVDEVLTRYGAEPDRVLATGLRQSWRADAGTPLLFLNTTDLYSGDRVVQSPLDAFLPPAQVEEGEEAPPATNPARVRILANDGGERDLSVANAAVLSARFPLVSPPGRYRECTDDACSDARLKQIADGGYFDNTGLETIADILTAIAPVLGDTAVEVISYSIDELTDAQREAARVTKGTLAAPIGGVIAATTARRALTVDRFCERWIEDSGTRTAASARLDLTTEATHNFTLSWLLSKASFGQIARKVAGYHGAEAPLCR